MGIFSRLFFFKRTDINLQEKWWHRFFVVLFNIFVIAFFLFSFLTMNVVIPEKTFNVDIKYNLREFTKNSSKDIADTVPAFNLLNYQVGCLENGKINSVPYYALNETICSSDLRGNIDKVAEIWLQKHPLIKDTKEQTIIKITTVLDEDTETRYCFVSKDANCISDKIISYKRNLIFYLEMFLASLVSTYLVVLILRFIYFKVLIYIIYGKKK